jgi:hypothetical protein
MLYMLLPIPTLENSQGIRGLRLLGSVAAPAAFDYRRGGEAIGLSGRSNEATENIENDAG